MSPKDYDTIQYIKLTVASIVPAIVSSYAALFFVAMCKGISVFMKNSVNWKQKPAVNNLNCSCEEVPLNISQSNSEVCHTIANMSNNKIEKYFLQ